MDRCGNFTEMLQLMLGTTLIWVAARFQHSSATSLAPASAGHWCMTEPSFLQTMRGFVKYEHPQQLPLCPLFWLTKVCCPPPLTPAPATTLLRAGALPSRSIL